MTVYLVCSLDDGPGPNDGVVLEVKVGRGKREEWREESGGKMGGNG